MNKEMTWREYLEQQIEAGANPELAQMAVGHMMDLYESWEWDDKIPQTLLEKSL